MPNLANLALFPAVCAVIDTFFYDREFCKQHQEQPISPHAAQLPSNLLQTPK